MNNIKDVSYSDMAEEYFKSAEGLHKYLEKLKADKKLKRKNPEAYNSRISQVRSIYTDCMCCVLKKPPQSWCYVEV